MQVLTSLDVMLKLAIKLGAMATLLEKLRSLVKV